MLPPKPAAGNVPDPAWLDSLCTLPDILRSLEDYERAHHQDLPSTATALLVRERARAFNRLCYEHDPFALRWLEARVDAIDGELAARLTAAAHDPRRQTAPLPLAPPRPASSVATGTARLRVREVGRG